MSKEIPNALRQNISIITVGGAHAYIFLPLLNFFEIKTLIITDIDIKKDESTKTTNTTLKKMLKKDSIDDLKALSIEQSTINNICITYQKDGTSSFEDNFYKKNKNFILNNKEKFNSIKNKSELESYGKDKDNVKFTDKHISKKTDFAIDILFYSDDKNLSWEIPDYIKEGLEWLLKQ